jgi:hypothetical protein
MLPAPTLPPNQVEQLLARQTGRPVRGRKSLARIFQSQSPLEIISKGRFDETDPDIHKGEDLDVPTYFRHGMALNWVQPRSAACARDPAEPGAFPSTAALPGCG